MLSGEHLIFWGGSGLAAFIWKWNFLSCRGTEILRRELKPSRFGISECDPECHQESKTRDYKHCNVWVNQPRSFQVPEEEAETHEFSHCC